MQGDKIDNKIKNKIVPDQINVRAAEEVATAKPVIAKKNIADMDPEGNE